jgi:hypothetical protein
LSEIQKSSISAKLDQEQVKVIEQMINIQLSAFAQRIEEKLDAIKQTERRVSDPMNILSGQLETGNFD